MHSQPHPQLAAIAAMLRAEGVTAADPLTTPLAEARAAALRYNAVWNRLPPDLAEVSELDIPVARGRLPLRLYRPLAEAEHLPVLVYFHGGGFVLNGLDTHDRLMRLLALRSGAAVVGVGYGLAPEHRFPSQIDDALAALRWLEAEGAAHGLDAGRLAVGGDSAGANLALALQLRLRDAGLPLPAAGLLLYGMFSADLDTPSHRAFGTGAHGLTSERVEWFWDQYLADRAQRDNPLAAPLYAFLDGLPRQTIIAAGLDCLLDDSLRLAAKLEAAGVPHSLSVHGGVPHSFMLMSAVLEPADRAVTEAARAVRLGLRPPR